MPLITGSAEVLFLRIIVQISVTLRNVPTWVLSPRRRGSYPRRGNRARLRGDRTHTGAGTGWDELRMRLDEVAMRLGRGQEDTRMMLGRG
eukprot:gene24173-biopygen22369